MNVMSTKVTMVSVRDFTKMTRMTFRDSRMPCVTFRTSPGCCRARFWCCKAVSGTSNSVYSQNDNKSPVQKDASKSNGKMLKQYLSPALYEYITAHTRESEGLKSTRMKTYGKRGAHMMVPPEQAAFLKMN